jgi:hypothetical protein
MGTYFLNLGYCVDKSEISMEMHLFGIFDLWLVESMDAETTDMEN